MSNDEIVKLMKEIGKKIEAGEKEGELPCPFCDGMVRYLYDNPMAMRVWCAKCGQVNIRA